MEQKSGGEGAAVVQSKAMVQNRAAVVQSGTEMEQLWCKMEEKVKK